MVPNELDVNDQACEDSRATEPVSSTIAASERPTVFVSGALANKPFNGGNAWSRLSWALGFQRLGFEVCFVEQIDSQHCVDATGAVTSFDHSINLAYFQSTLEQFDLGRRCSLICDQGRQVHGLRLEALRQKAKQAILLFNFSGHLAQPELIGNIGCKVYFDDDPGFTQFWHADGNPGTRLAGHDFYFTIGANIGKPDCPIPTGGISWHHTRPPVVLEHWPARTPGRFDRFTTIASWRGAYGPVQHKGTTYGLKVHEFRKFIELPQRNGARFEIALQIDPADQKDREALLQYGWHLVDPKSNCGSTESFRTYIENSGAEFSAAQGLYVQTNSGWFSDRTVRYLAAGRPALVQDTGINNHLPVGEGLVTFLTLHEAVAGAESIERDYQRHCRAARRIAEDYFDSDKVVRELIDTVGLHLPRDP